MSKKKFLLKSKSSTDEFDSKNDFVNTCQASYNECFKKGFGSKKFEIYYSFDYGASWNNIENFKSQRQVIQNEKNTDFVKVEAPTKIKSEKKESSFFSTLFKLVLIVLAIYGISSFLKEEPKNKIENPVKKETQNTSEDITSHTDGAPMDDITEIPEETSSQENPKDENGVISKNEAYKIIFGAEMAGDATSPEELKARAKTARKVICPTCSGDKSQKYTCPKCKGRILVNCYQCNGTGGGSEICRRCRGNMQIPCTHCNGTGEISCPTCDGRGTVLKYGN